MRQHAHGVQITDPLLSTTMVPIHLEKIEFQAGANAKVITNGGVSINLPLSTQRDAHLQEIEVHGKQNTIQVDMAELMDGKLSFSIDVKPGAQVTLQLSNAAQILSQPRMVSGELSKAIEFSEASDLGSARQRYLLTKHKAATGEYQLQLNDRKDAANNASITVTLDSNDPMVHAAFLAALPKSMRLRSNDSSAELLFDGEQARAALPTAPVKLSEGKTAPVKSPEGKRKR